MDIFAEDFKIQNRKMISLQREVVRPTPPVSWVLRVRRVKKENAAWKGFFAGVGGTAPSRLTPFIFYPYPAGFSPE